jgi:hypothetical protein
MSTVSLSERIEKVHRQLLVTDTRAAAARGMAVSDFRAQRDAAVAHWTKVVRGLMDEHEVSDPAQILPEICAAVQEKASALAREEVRVLVRVEVKRLLKRVLEL